MLRDLRRGNAVLGGLSVRHDAPNVERFINFVPELDCYVPVHMDTRNFVRPGSTGA